MTFYRDAFGLAEADRFDFDEFALVYLSNAESGFEVEPTLDKGQTEPYELGYGHLTDSVDDLEAEHRRFGEAGFEPRRLVTLKKDGEADPPGVLDAGNARVNAMGYWQVRRSFRRGEKEKDFGR